MFFNALGLRYEYEKEGYALHCGWYLPDFFLPDLKFWLEVKGIDPTGDEICAAGFLLDATGYPSVIAVGAPQRSPQLIPLPWPMTGDEADRGSGDFFPAFWFCDAHRDGVRTVAATSEDRGTLFVGGRSLITKTTVASAIEAARSARFERGH